ncbi:hypothetical protein CPB85DRAFT_874356 [Mucidula mucida]|nr:hypothetical protein CPB85DRAFT_874356 [Mucidula mucida]
MKLSVMICILVVVNINSLKGSVLRESRPKLHVKPSMRFEEDLTLVRMPLRKHEAVQGVRPSRTKAVSLKSPASLTWELAYEVRMAGRS